MEEKGRKKGARRMEKWPGAKRSKRIKERREEEKGQTVGREPVTG